MGPHESHELTDKEIKALDDAASLVKKFAKYIKSVNLDNKFLRENLDNAIKAGDVTNAQKVHLRCYDDAEKCHEDLLKEIKEKCRAKKPDCNCSDDERENCPLYHEYTIAWWMRDVAHGSSFNWKTIFQYASMAYKLFRLNLMLHHMNLNGQSAMEYYNAINTKELQGIRSAIEFMESLKRRH